MKKVTKLEVGNIIYCINSGDVVARYPIERVTATQAMTKHEKFDREIFSDGTLRQIKRDTWSQYHYCIATPELDKEWKLVIALRQMEKAWDELDRSKLTIEQVETITKTLGLK